MYCRGCGVHAPDDANYCVSCGADLREFEDDDVDSSDDTLDDLPAVTVSGVSATDDTQVVPTQREDGDSDEELTACPACGAPNSPNRYLCGRCGTDLRTGEATGRVAVVPSPAAGARPRRHPTTDDLEGVGSDRRWRIAAAIVTVGILIGGVLGAMVALQLGPFSSGSGSDGDGPVFDRSAYPERPDPLPASSVATSTAQTGTSASFDPGQLLDGDVTTAWNSRGDVNPDGIGEIIQVDFADPVWLAQIVVANGDQNDEGAFVANARAKRVEVTLSGGSSFIVNLLDQTGQQSVRLPVPRLTTSVRFEVLEVYPGDTYEDLGLSELEFRGYPANEQDAETVRADEG